MDVMDVMAEQHVGGLCWHVHHDKLCEVLLEPIQNRAAYIRAQKPQKEIEMRLRLMKVVVGPLPAVVNKAWDELDKARAEWHKARAEWHKAGDEWNKTRAEYDKVQAKRDKALNGPEMAALHAIECPNCPWNGQTIFPNKA